MNELTRREFNRVKANIVGSVDKLIDKYGKQTVNDIKMILNSGNKRAFGKLINGIRFEKLDDRFVIVMEQYAAFINSGTKTKKSVRSQVGVSEKFLSGKVTFTPLKKGSFFTWSSNPQKSKDMFASIDKWVQKKGIVERKKGAIAHSIWKFGIKPTPFTFKIVENNNKLQQEIAKTASLFVKIKMKTK